MSDEIIRVNGFNMRVVWSLKDSNGMPSYAELRESLRKTQERLDMTLRIAMDQERAGSPAWRK